MARRQSFSLCKAAKPRGGVLGSTVLVRAGREECSEKDAAFLQQPIRVSLLSQPAPVPMMPTPPTPAPTPEGTVTAPPLIPPEQEFENYTTLTPAYCFSPVLYPRYEDANSAIEACNSDKACAGIFDSWGVTDDYWSSHPGFWMCKAPNNNFGCGSWYQEQIQGLVYWKQNNTNNNECQSARGAHIGAWEARV